MGKKTSKRRKNKQNAKFSNEVFANRKFVVPVFILAIGLALGTVYYATKPSLPSGPTAPAMGQLIENRPVLNPVAFVGKAAQAYRVAAKIPKVIDSLFCYCYCKKDHGHKTLLTCFTSEHGSKCDTCIGEVLYAYELYKDGKSLDDIVEAVDKKFYRPYRSHPF
tara:strand:+ start:635 stop:1126 length:492 start_codon:yes stop_codon:yes gene_type:complete